MKKNIGIFAFFVTACALTLVTSCLPNNEEDDGIAAPTVYKNTTSPTAGRASYTISFAPIDKMEYANIFRTNTSTNEIVNIGQVIPTNKDAMPSAFVFEDPYTTDGIDYTYAIRFYNGSYYSYSKSSPTISGLNDTTVLGFGEAQLTASDTSGVTNNSNNNPEILYVCNNFEGEEEYSLRLGTKTTVTLPDGFLQLCVIIGPSEKSRKPFTLKKFANTTEPEYPNIIARDSILSTQNGAKAEPVDLQKLLPDAYFDTSLEIPALIGVKKIGKSSKDTNDDDAYIKNANYATYYWTNPKDIYLTWYEKRNDQNGTETVGKKESDGTYSGDATSTITVPKLVTPENSFDYSNRSATSLTNLAISEEDLFDFSPYNP